MKTDAHGLPKIRRPSIRPLDEWVDDFMRGFGLQVVDPAKPETLARLRKYAHSWMKHCLRSTLSDLQRGAKRGMAQSLAFMFDPDHAQTLKRGRKVRADRRQEQKLERDQTAALKERKQLGRLQ